MFSPYSPQGNRLVPQAQGFAECASEVLPFRSGYQVLDTRPATTGPGFWREPPVFSEVRSGLGSIQRAVANNPAPLCANLSGLGAEPIAARAYKEGNFSWIDLQPEGGPPMRITHEIMSTRGLGVGPLVAGGAVAAAGAVAALTALVQNVLEDDWRPAAAFRAHTTTIANSMQVIQCLVGGASGGAYGCPPNSADDSECICPAGTKPVCPLPAGVLTEWRLLRREWSEFYGLAGSEGSDFFGGATEGEAATAKIFAQRMFGFYDQLVSQYCPQDAATQAKLPNVSAGDPRQGQLQTTDLSETPGWLKWSVAGGALLVAFMGLKVVQDVFGD